MSKKVSVIVPVYNLEKYIHVLLDSLLKQTYENVEVVIVDDGSTDGTAEEVKKYISNFAKHKKTLKYVYKKNSGIAKTVNVGLSEITGDYLIWPDGDDWIEHNAIEMMVDFLESHDGYHIARSGYKVVDEKGKTKVIESSFTEDVFVPLIKEKYQVVPIRALYMIDVKKYFDTIKDKKILEDKNASGQNLQLVLPLAYKNKCGYIEQPFYSQLQRTDSDSRKKRDRWQMLKYRSGVYHTKKWCLKVVNAREPILRMQLWASHICMCLKIILRG